MSGLAHSAAGLAMVLSLALHCTRSGRMAFLTLALQSGLVAIAALLLSDNIMAVSPIVLTAGLWFVGEHQFVGNRRPMADISLTATLGVTGVITVLCQSQGLLAIPLTIVLLSGLLLACRDRPWMHAVGLVGLQNGIVLAVLLAAPRPLPETALLGLAVLCLPLPVVLGALPSFFTERVWIAAVWAKWLDLSVAIAIAVATLFIPLDAFGSLFAPVIALDGVMRSWKRGFHPGMPLMARGAGLLGTIILVLAVVLPEPVAAWLAMLGAIGVGASRPSLREWDARVLALLGAGVALFGLILVPTYSTVGYFSLLIGFVGIAAARPDLTAVLAIIVLRLASHSAWPQAADALGAIIASVGLLACAFSFCTRSYRFIMPLLMWTQAATALLAVSLGTPDGRFAALVLLILLVLTHSAGFDRDNAIRRIAVAGLGVASPVGVFPGTVLVVLAVAGHNPWLLLPMGAALVPMVARSFPARALGIALPAGLYSVGWLPLALVVLVRVLRAG